MRGFKNKKWPPKVCIRTTPHSAVASRKVRTHSACHIVGFKVIELRVWHSFLVI